MYKKDTLLNHIALVGSYVPRRCGIATFTKDVYDSLKTASEKSAITVLAMDDEKDTYPYPEEVRFQIREQEEGDYPMAAELLNINQVDVTFLQHEYGIFGGRDGNLALNFMRRLRMPIIVTLHTVLEKPTPGQEKILRSIAEIADKLVVMSEKGRQFLLDIYDTPADKIAFIPHGIPDLPFTDSSFFKDQFGLEGRMVMLTFGLLSPGKGIETVLHAMPKLIRRHPGLTYVILGATHPGVLRHEGDAYRNKLERLVEQLDLKDHVTFHNRFVPLDELCRYIGAADLYVTPYLNPAQIASGTLAYACGAGKAVLSTPYWYAEEMLAEDRGILFPFGDSETLAERIDFLLRTPTERDAMRKRAYLYGRKMVWSEVGRQYLKLGEQVVARRREEPRKISPRPAVGADNKAIPRIDLRHVHALTDDTGMYQHAVYTIPDRSHGYCTDDNARALIAVLRHYELRRQDSVLPLAYTYLAFLHSAFDPESLRFRNFLSYDRHWLEKKGSEDSHARAVWALGEAVALAPNESILGYTTRLFNAALPSVEKFSAVRSWSFALIGIHAYLEKFGGDTHVRRLRETLAQRLLRRFRDNASDDWPWCESILTYDNAKIAHSLVLSGKWLEDAEMLETGLRALEWLFTLQTGPEGFLNVIGCDGWFPRGEEPARFDQQPVELMALADAAAEAYIQTGDRRWNRRIRLCLDWFLGRNLMGVPLYDFKTGGCRDGLNPQGANANQGAESTLAWLITLLTVTDIEGRDRLANIPV